VSWRDILKVHPACELFPPLPPDELKALGDDIQKNRLQERAKVMCQGDKFVLIDGRSRLDAIEAVGLSIKVFEGGTPNNKFFEVVEVDDPIAFVISANIRRRHLTAEQKRELIGNLLKADPEKSNRQIADQVKVSHPHVAKVRAELEKTGDVETVTTSVDTKGRKQPARRPRLSAPPSDAPAPAPPAPRKLTTGPIIEQCVNDGERAGASRVLEIARRIRACDPRSDIVTLCNWIEKYAVPMLAATVAAEASEHRAPASEADNRAGVVPSPSFYEAALKTIETFEGSASQLLDWWRSRVKDRAKLALEDQTRLSQVYGAKFRELPSHEGGTP
jgi:DNA-binding Lrp family transcriptional regulator